MHTISEHLFIEFNNSHHYIEKFFSKSKINHLMLYKRPKNLKLYAIKQLQYYSFCFKLYGKIMEKYSFTNYR